MSNNSRNVIRMSHLRVGCPICSRAVDQDHEEALAGDALIDAIAAAFENNPADFSVVYAA